MLLDPIQTEMLTASLNKQTLGLHKSIVVNAVILVHSVLKLALELFAAVFIWKTFN
jgi:hypothetical protein